MEDLIDEIVDALVREYALPPRCRFYLGSIAFQLVEHGYTEENLRKEITGACRVPQRYPDPVASLRKLDIGLDQFYQRLQKGKHVGTLEEFYGCEDSIFSVAWTKPLCLRGLEMRINETLLGIVEVSSHSERGSNERDSRLRHGIRVIHEGEEMHPSQEKAYRILEDS